MERWFDTVTAANHPLYIEQGSTFTLGITWHRAAVDADGNPILDADGNEVAGEPFDLTGCTARTQIRRRISEPLLLEATSLLSGPGAGRIVLGGTSGRMDLTLTDEDTMLLTVRRAVYDLELEWPLQPGEIRPRVDRLLEGEITVVPNVTREEP